MRVVSNDTFVPIADTDPASRDSLIVHAHGVAQNRKLVVFVHGLGGRRYMTWGNLPEFLFDDSSDFDIGLYDYASGARRLLRRDSIALNTHARELADDLRDGSYDAIILIGHSMGGLLCKAVVMQLIDSQARMNGGLAVDRLAGLFLMATPQAGSLRVPTVLAYASKDARVLRAHSEFVSEVNRRFNDRVCSDGRNDLQSADRFVIPTYAVLATGDSWVDELSAGLSLPSEQIKHIRGSHRSLVKPESRDGGIYRWLLHKIDECFADAVPEEHLRVSAAQSIAGKVALVDKSENTGDRFQAGLRDVVVDYLDAYGLGRLDIDVSIKFNVPPGDRTFQ
jgi:pimeloyl-ACP methyl ester carboxylesterase